jgi:hypothetical protein
MCLVSRVFGNYFDMEVAFPHARELTEYVRNEAIIKKLNIIDDSARCSENRMRELGSPPSNYSQYNFMVISNRKTAMRQVLERINILGRDNKLKGIDESAMFASQTLLPWVFKELKAIPTFIFTPTAQTVSQFKLVASNRRFISYSNNINIPPIEYLNSKEITIHDQTFWSRIA